MRKERIEPTLGRPAPADTISAAAPRAPSPLPDAADPRDRRGDALPWMRGRGRDAEPSGALPATAPEPAEGEAPMLRSPALEYRGSGRAMLLLALRNLFLTLVTLGVYGFWAVAAERRKVWGALHLGGEPFAWAGTGRETFWAAVRVGLVIGALQLLGYLAALTLGADEDQVSLAIFAVLIVLGYFALYGAIRYRTNRTTWRGIRFAQGGHAGGYSARLVLWTLASVVTLGIASPWTAAAERRYRIGRRSFGTEGFAFDGRGSGLIAALLLAVLLGVFAWLGISVLVAVIAMLAFDASALADLRQAVSPGGEFDPGMAPWWLFVVVLLPVVFGFLTSVSLWEGAKARFTLANTRLDGLVLRPRTGTIGYGMAHVGWALLGLLTLGLLRGWLLHRRVRFVARDVAVEGTLDLGRIGQAKRSADAEGLAGFLAVDA